MPESMPWATYLHENPFAPAIAIVRANLGGMQTPPGDTQAESTKVEPCSPVGQPSAKPNREEIKMQQYCRLFEEQAAKEERRKKMQALKQEREERDPCTCGRSKARRLPRPLSAGGPRCNTCTPFVSTSEAAELREAPVFRPTEEEFADPMEYIRSIQAEVYEYGICRIQPPPSWKPPAAFHWRETTADDEVAAAPESNDGAAADGTGAREQGVVDYQPITDDNLFYARLQTVKQRPSSLPSAHPAPFICSFTPKYDKYTRPQLREMDERLRDDVFPDSNGEKLPAEAVENWFWEGLASHSEARILYSSDLEGTAFPASGPYGVHPWSLQCMANHERSLLRFVDYAIPGVNAPMLYNGMLFSMFCWHVEDSNMYSASYLHEGATKTWYGVSPRDAAAFDRVFTSAFPQAMEKDPQLLLRKASMVPPSLLVANGVAVSRARQEAGEFVITLPQSYHAGFSHGFNTAEAVNFMLLDCLPYAEMANLKYSAMAREPVLDLEQILLRAAAAQHSPEVSGHFEECVAAELEQRRLLRAYGCTERMQSEEDMDAALGRGPPCSVCGHVCHISYVLLGNTSRVDRPKASGKASEHDLVCLRHYEELEADEPAQLTMHLRYNDEYLRKLVEKRPKGKQPLTATLPLPIDDAGDATNCQHEKKRPRWLGRTG